MKLQPEAKKGFRLDLGCGAVKKEGTIGIDIAAFPGVDHVLDMESQPLPFADQTVRYIYSSHFLEHTTAPESIFVEIGRVCQDGAQVELWTPYAWHNDALLPGHRYYFTEECYLHICVMHPDVWQQVLRSRWVLNEVQYVIREEVLASLKAQNISVNFAVKHMLNIVKEFCVYITVLHHTPLEPLPQFKRTYSTNRYGERFDLSAEALPLPPPPPSPPPPPFLPRLRRILPTPVKRLIKSLFQAVSASRLASRQRTQA